MRRLSRQTNNPSAQCLTAVAIDRNLWLPFLGSIFRAPSFDQVQPIILVPIQACSAHWLAQASQNNKVLGQNFSCPKEWIELLDSNCWIVVNQCCQSHYLFFCQSPLSSYMSRGLVKGRITSYRNAVDCIQGKLEMKRLGQIHRIRKGYPVKARLGRRKVPLF